MRSPSCWNTASVGQLKNAISGKTLHLLINYTYTVVAWKVAKAGRVSLILVARMNLPISVVEDVEVVVISVVGVKNVDNGIQE